VAGPLDTFASESLAAFEAAGLLRTPDDGARRRQAQLAAAGLGAPFIDASSNDYLGLAAQIVSRETDVQGATVGAGASRLIHGSRDAQLALERELAAWVGLPESLLFTSGYAANVGLVSALGEAGTVVLSDQLNHASIIDGCRLSKADVEVVPHLDSEALARLLARHSKARARWVVTEACFSMDGDGPDLPRLRRLCDDHGAGLIVDEAHSLGVMGPRGAGRCAEAGVKPDALVGTLGKAVGSQGAFVAGSIALRTLLWNRARSFVFSTASSPLLARVTTLHVERARGSEAERSALSAMVASLRAELAALGVRVESGLGGPIIPILVGDNHSVMRAALALESEGILAQAIRPPTVPEGSARLRLTVSASWPEGAPSRVAAAVARALESHA
jgi:8-amino-7-oxononanoate synthase